jgi:hypothetical protein
MAPDRENYAHNDKKAVKTEVCDNVAPYNTANRPRKVVGGIIK